MVNGVRDGFPGTAEVDPRTSLVVLVALTAAVALIDVVLFRRSYAVTD